MSIQAMKGQRLQAGCRHQGYQKYTASFLVAADAPLTSLAELKGRKLGAPDEDSITSWMVRATLRDAKVEPAQIHITYTRYQDAVPSSSRTGSPIPAPRPPMRWSRLAGQGGKILAHRRRCRSSTSSPART